MWIVVNVDDLGLHPAVARAVEAGAAAGVVTSASVLANGPALEDVVSRYRRGAFDRVGLGAHLNLSRGRPLSPAREIRSLVDARGLFPGLRRTLVRAVRGRLVLAEVEREWGRQIAALRDRGIELDHLDSEHHVHAWPSLMAVAGRLAARHRIRWVRRPVERTRRFDLGRGAAKAKLLAAVARGHRPSPGVSWTSATWGIAEAGRLDASELAEAIRAGREDTVLEVVCHPGLIAEGDPPLGSELGPVTAAARWGDEARGLLSPAFARALGQARVRLARFAEVR